MYEFFCDHLDFSFSVSGLISGLAVPHTVQCGKTGNIFLKITATWSHSLHCIAFFFFPPQHLCDLLLQAAQRRPLGAWNEKVFLRTHPSVTSGSGWGTHGSSQIHSGLSVRVFAWHDAPKRSPAHEITFIQPSHAWLDCFGFRTVAG